MKDRSNQIEHDGSATVKLQETCDAEIASSTISNMLYSICANSLFLP